jgi:hypothetical protein
MFYFVNGFMSHCFRQITARRNAPDKDGNWAYREVELLRLDVIDDYNHNMNGVDIADQHRQVCKRCFCLNLSFLQIIMLAHGSPFGS